jgi:hypothetical protein
VNRDSVFYFNVAATDYPSEPTIIPGRKLVATAPASSECWITTTLEIFMPNEWNEEEGHYGVYREVSTNDFHTQYLTEDDKMYISFDASQNEFIEEIAP